MNIYKCNNMNIEYEATFPKIDKKEVRSLLKKAKASLVQSEVLQKRLNFFTLDDNKNSWIRVRDEGDDNIIMSYKIVPDSADNIEEQKEVCVKVESFKKAKNFLISLGFQEKSYQETKRETWNLGKAEVTINEWPFLSPFLEIEANSEKEVKKACKDLNFDYNKALFCNVFLLYSKEYNTPIDVLKRKVSSCAKKLTFSDKNPFIKK